MSAAVVAPAHSRGAREGMSNTDASMTLTPRIVGHRGAALRAPENTLAGLRRGIVDGAALLEIDVRLSADGHIVVIHDATVDRTAEEFSPRRTGAIASLTREEIDQVRVGGGEPVPALADVLALLDEHGAEAPHLYVEVKVLEAAVPTARALAGRRGVTVISFLPDALRAVRAVAPDVPRGYIVKETDLGTGPMLAELGASALCVAVGTVRDHDRQIADAAGAQLNIWTVNDIDGLRRAIAVGADTITSDDPAWARAETAAILAPSPMAVAAG